MFKHFHCRPASTTLVILAMFSVLNPGQSSLELMGLMMGRSSFGAARSGLATRYMVMVSTLISSKTASPVDSGLLGAVPVELVEQPPAEFETDLILDCPGGLIIGYDKTAGTFFFAHHVIYTDFVDYDEEYDEEYDQRDDDIFI